jgi:hypothetical protein
MGAVLTMHMHIPPFKSALYSGGGGRITKELRSLFQVKDVTRVGMVLFIANRASGPIKIQE